MRRCGSKELLEHTHGKEPPESDLRVILRGKSLEFYPATTARFSPARARCSMSVTPSWVSISFWTT